MQRKASWRRRLGALVIGLFGTLGVCALSLGMNSQVEQKATEPVSMVAEVAVSAAPKAKPTQKKQRSSPTKRLKKAAPSAAPLLAASLGGLDFGFGAAADAAMADATNALIGDMGATVMDEDAVDDPPTPTEQTPPSFPARARSLGLSGWVTLSFVVDVDGSVQDVHVVESNPPDTFDDAAMEAARTWRFTPGREEGNPVAVRVRQTLRFSLE
jgi:periplasmic protein TonB